MQSATLMGTTGEASPASPPGTFGALAERLRSLVYRTQNISDDATRVRDAILGGHPDAMVKGQIKAAPNGHIETLDVLMDEISDSIDAIGRSISDLQNKV